MELDFNEDLEKGPFCKPYGQLFYENLEKMPSLQVMEGYLSCLLEAQDRIQKAISILEGILKRGSDKLRQIDKPMDIQYMFGKVTGNRGEIEKEIEHLARHRREIDAIIAQYSEKGVFRMPIKDFMMLFDAEFKIKVEKKKTDSQDLYVAEINGNDLAGCAGFDHLNKVMSGYLLSKLMKKNET